MTLNAAPGQVTPGVNVSSILVVSNTAPGSFATGLAVFFDASPKVNGAPAAGPAPAYASFAPGSAGSVVIKVAASGAIVSVFNAAGVPYLPVPFPAGAPSVPQPAGFPAGSKITLGGGAATAAPFAGTFSSFSIAG